VKQRNRIAILLRVFKFAVNRRDAASQRRLQLRQRADEDDQFRVCSSGRKSAHSSRRQRRISSVGWSLLTSAATVQECPSLRQRPPAFQFRHDFAAQPVQFADGQHDVRIKTIQHGPNGGDEVNLILPGKNYGWPDYSFGRNYEGPRISERPLGPATEQPLVLWIPSIAPTGMTVYTGDRIATWTGNLFVGSARRGQIPRTGGLERVVLNENLEELRRESLLTELRQRIRDVRQGPDGLLYVVTDEDDAVLLRISPGSL
jgi:hypothetical protein